MKAGITYIDRLVLTHVLMLMSPLVFASTDKIPWTVYLFSIVAISLVVAFILSKGNKTAEGLAVKIFLGGLYFWLITFVQLTVLAVIYHFIG